jgi:phosphoribosylcarboxyaminoimidazole (NCAIR) mutase
MSAAEIVLLYETPEERACFQEAQAILQQMGVSFREQALPAQPTLASLRQTIESLGTSVCIWAVGRSAYLLPVLAASLTATQPLVVIPCPNETIAPYVEAILNSTRGYPIAFTRPHDSQAAALLAVHILATRHPSYADLLQAYFHKKHLQPV